MTTFEITIIVLLAVIAIIITNGVALIAKKLNRIAEQHKSTWSHFDNVVCQLYGIKETVNSIYNAIGADGCNNFKKLSELTDIVDKMHRNLCVEIADKMVDRVYKQPTSVNGTPCYAPDGICTNPCRDCINCPKRGTGGTWSTNISIKAEDAPLQEKFNDNKED